MSLHTNFYFSLNIKSAQCGRSENKRSLMLNTQRKEKHLVCTNQRLWLNAYLNTYKQEDIICCGLMPTYVYIEGYITCCGLMPILTVQHIWEVNKRGSML